MFNATLPAPAAAARRGYANASIVWLMLCAAVGGWLIYRSSRPATPSVAHEHLAANTVALANAQWVRGDAEASRTINIEQIRVGQRVATDGGLANQGRVAADASRTAVNPQTWRMVTLSAEQEWSDGTRDTWEVQTLQPPEWLAVHSPQPGGEIDFSTILDLAEMGAPLDLRGRVISVGSTPPIDSGTGRVVLTTVNHLNNFVLELILADGANRFEALGVTGWHRFFSESRGWVNAADLELGETLRGRNGPVVVKHITREPDARRVYNLTVEGDHVYHVGQLATLAHNSCDAVSKSIARHERKEARHAAHNRARIPQYENPGHHDTRNLPGKLPYDPRKDPLPPDAHTAFQGAIQSGGSWYGRGASGEYYRYAYHQQSGPNGARYGAVHFTGRTGDGYRGFPVPADVRRHFEK